jgi:hypothetical protein
MSRPVAARMTGPCSTMNPKQHGAIRYAELVELCGNRLGRFDTSCPLCGPGRRAAVNRKRPVLRVWHQEPGFASYACARCSESGWSRDGDAPILKPRPRPAPKAVEQDDADAIKRQHHAAEIWRTSVPLVGTLAHRYLVERRGLHIGTLDLAHCLRWSEREHAVIALMTDATTNEPTGVHRTFLNQDGTKRERRMLGRQGVIRLSADEHVTQGLGICEGIEDGLRILLSGWAPIWVATSAGAIAKFPVLSGVESLTIFQDEGDVGEKAARSCADAWAYAWRDARIASVKDFPQ